MIADIKNKIKGHLQALVDAGTLGSWQAVKFPEEFQNFDIGKYPCAILLPSTQTGVYKTNRQIQCTYTFDLMVVEKGENVADDTTIETLCESVRHEFDNDATLGGAADAGLPPTSSETARIGSGDQTYVLFFITLQPQTLVDVN